MPPFDLSDLVFLGNRVVALPPAPLALQFRHRTIAGVSTSADNVEFPYYWTRLDHPRLNNMPQAILTVTPVGRIDINAKTHTATLRHNDTPVGVVYRGDPLNRWYIYNLKLEAMDVGVDFHVAIHEDVATS